MDKTTEEVWNEMSYEQQLSATDIVFKAIWEHMVSGGTYRHLIYDRLEFKPDAYVTLYPTGMHISNYCHDANKAFEKERQKE